MISKNFEINDNNNIRCKIYCNDIHKINKVVIFEHGFGGHKDNKAAERFATSITSKEKASAVIVFNWPCHGDDIKKKLKLSDCNDYLEAVIRHVKESMGVDDIYAYGTSFGGYLVLKYISEHGNPFKKIALRCPAVNMYKVMIDRVLDEDGFRLLEKGKDALVGFDRKVLISNAFLDELKENDITKREYIDFADDILILHGTKDELIPIDEVSDFCEENVIEFISVENADHRFKDINQMNQANHTIMEFLQDNLR